MLVSFSCVALFISIHALLAESDVIREPATGRHDKFLSTLSLRRATREPTALRTPHQNFYPRSPCGERQQLIYKRCKLNRFLSTLSLRRATPPCAMLSSGREYFYPRSPCGERLYLGRQNPERAEFLSTLSLRRAT